MGDAVHKVQRDPLDLLTVEHDKVIFEDQERAVCDENDALFFVVPMIHPEGKKTEEECVRPTEKNNFLVPIFKFLNKQNLGRG